MTIVVVVAVVLATLTGAAFFVWQALTAKWEGRRTEASLMMLLTAAVLVAGPWLCIDLATTPEQQVHTSCR